MPDRWLPVSFYRPSICCRSTDDSGVTATWAARFPHTLPWHDALPGETGVARLSYGRRMGWGGNAAFYLATTHGTRLRGVPSVALTLCRLPDSTRVVALRGTTTALARRAGPCAQRLCHRVPDSHLLLDLDACLFRCHLYSSYPGISAHFSRCSCDAWHGSRLFHPTALAAL